MAKAESLGKQAWDEALLRAVLAEAPYLRAWYLERHRRLVQAYLESAERLFVAARKGALIEKMYWALLRDIEAHICQECSSGAGPCEEQVARRGACTYSRQWLYEISEKLADDRTPEPF